MPAILSESHVFNPLVPSHWEAVLSDLLSFVRLEERMREDPNGPQDRDKDELQRLHQSLLDSSGDLLEPRSLEDLKEAELLEIFTQATLLMARLHECVATEDPVLDTAGSKILGHYSADFRGEAADYENLKDRLRATFRLSPATLRAVEAEVQWTTADARRKQRVVRALRDHFQLDETQDPEDLEAKVLTFFQSFFPDAPFLANEVRVILTGTLVFFCLPYKGDRLTSRDMESLPQEDRVQIEDLLSRVARFRQARFANFPAFGFLERDDLDPILLKDLAERSDLDPREVAHELVRMVTILPLDELDKYVVHDVWGHSWQASMLCFCSSYQEMSTYDQAFDLRTRVATPEGRPLRFQDCFRRRGSEVQLDPRAFEQFATGLVSERLPIALTAVLAETMADVAEFKVMVDEDPEPYELPTTSFFKGSPSKLDLTLRDVSFYFGQATKSLRYFARRKKRQSRIVDQLVELGASPQAAQASVEDAVEAWRELEEGILKAEIDWARDGDRIRTNVFTRAALNFLGIHRSILQTLEELGDSRPKEIPLRSFRDLVVLGAAAFFEADRGKNLWRVDEFLSLKLIPLCGQLARGHRD